MIVFERVCFASRAIELNLSLLTNPPLSNFIALLIAAVVVVMRLLHNNLIC